MNTPERPTPTWCPEQQIYIGGVIPENEQVKSMLEEGDGSLRLFGYGSLCWNPGTGALAKPQVKHVLGWARGYKRCWAQRSTDHRGNPNFPGLVCTLLKDEEVRDIRGEKGDHEVSLTEGLLYEVPPELVEECLEELDFREKGGYARDVVEVAEDKSGKSVKALLYRGTPDNPALWPRALLDLPFAAATMSVAVGPSGTNDVYLYSLDDFLKQSGANPAIVAAAEEHATDDDTSKLASMARLFQQQQLYFLFGCGSNQHNQLLLKSEHNAARLVNGEDAHEMKEIVVCTKRPDSDEPDPPVAIYSGGGHSGLQTASGKLFLWGWNENGQLGSSGISDEENPIPLVKELQGIEVKTAALGFSHTLVIEKDTGRLFAFGDNGRGQVDGTLESPSVSEPTSPLFLGEDRFVQVAAGLFHSAAITVEGELVTFGCGRFGQSLSSIQSKDVWIGRWKPSGGSRLNQVACGRRHTVVLDDQGRVYTFGDNKYGQLGRQLAEGKDRDDTPQQVALLPAADGDSFCVDVDCGWSHTIAVARDEDGSTSVFGWGRNDKGQLGNGKFDGVSRPTRLFNAVDGIQVVRCGSESTVIVDESKKIWSCGWNEHGNLSTGTNKDSSTLAPAVGAKLVTSPAFSPAESLALSAGGAHILTVLT